MISKLFVLLNDITDKEDGDIIERIGVEDKDSYETKPKKCPSCSTPPFSFFEIRLTSDVLFFFPCMMVGSRVVRRA